jgi:hypothetical protein
MAAELPPRKTHLTRDEILQFKPSAAFEARISEHIPIFPPRKSLSEIQLYVEETGQLPYVWNNMPRVGHLQNISDEEAQSFLQQVPHYAILRTASDNTRKANPAAVAVIGYMHKENNGSLVYRKTIITDTMIDKGIDLRRIVDPGITEVATEPKLTAFLWGSDEKHHRVLHLYRREDVEHYLASYPATAVIRKASKKAQDDTPGAVVVVSYRNLPGENSEDEYVHAPVTEEQISWADLQSICEHCDNFVTELPAMFVTSIPTQGGRRKSRRHGKSRRHSKSRSHYQRKKTHRKRKSSHRKRTQRK